MILLSSAKHKSAQNRYHVSAIMKLLSGTFLAEKAPAPGSKPIWGAPRPQIETSAIFYLPLLAFYLLDNGQLALLLKSQFVFSCKGSDLIPLQTKKGKKRNDRVSTLDSWTTKRWSGAHHQLFFSVNNDLSTGCEKQSEKIKLRLLLLWGCCRFFEKWRACSVLYGML